MKKFLLVLFSILLLAGCSGRAKSYPNAVFDENGLHWDGPMPRLEFDMSRFQSDQIADLTNVGEGNAVDVKLQLGVSDAWTDDEIKPEHLFGNMAPGSNLEADLSGFLDKHADIWNGDLILRYKLEGQTVTIVHKLDTGGELS